MSSTAFRNAASVLVALALAACGGAPSDPAASPSRSAPATMMPEASASPVATPTAESATAAATQPATPVAVTDWTAEIFDRPATPAGLNAIAQTGDRLVAVGTEAHNGAVWTRDPGDEWKSQPGVPAPAAENESIGLVDVVEGPIGLVAMGIVGAQNSEAFGTVIWTSDDSGMTWTEVQRIDGVLLGSVAAGDTGLIAMGSGAGIAAATPVVVWTSVDGTEWQQVDTEALGAGGMLDAIWRVDGFLGVGFVQEVGDNGMSGPPTATAWTSPDGETWTAIWSDETQNTFMEGVAATGDGLIAVGNIPDPAVDPRPGAGPQAWQSADGTSWERTEIDSERGQILDLGASETGFAAVGFMTRGATQVLGLWTSPDGVSWTHITDVADEAQGALRGAVVLPDRVVAVGGTRGTRDAEARPIVVTGPLP